MKWRGDPVAIVALQWIGTVGQGGWGTTESPITDQGEPSL